MVNANGYTQRLPQLFQALLEATLAIPPRKISLSRRSPGIPDDGFRRKGQSVRAGDYARAMLSQVPYFSRDERRKILPSIR